MRKSIIILMFCGIFSFVGFSQTEMMYSKDGRKIYLKERKDMAFLTFDPAKQITLKTKVQSQNMSIRACMEDRMVVSGDSLTISQNIAEWDKNISIKGKVLQYENSDVLRIATNKLFVWCGNATLHTIFRNGVIKNSELIDEQKQIYLVHLRENNAMEMARQLNENKVCEFAEPCFTLLMKPDGNFSTDQWGLKNTGQYGGISGIDIKAEGAWKYTKGDPNIKVAVLDEGIDLTHPDLIGNLLPGYDATGRGSNGGYEPNSNDAHGTACAGIIAALDNNDGIVGVAPKCKIIPIRIAYSSGNSWLLDESWFINAIRYAWYTAKADVLSISVSDDSYDVPSATFQNELSYATTLGRGNKGCVIVGSAGNNGRNRVNFPASHPNVIAVGAISPCGERKSYLPQSCDGESLVKGSNYGDGLSVVAPGVLVSTIDLQGNKGINPNNPMHRRYGGSKRTSDYPDQNYTAWFNGTSAACPFVAGTAALVLSINSTLSAQQVRDIIETTANRVGAYTYQVKTGYPNGTWHSEMGYGMVNAYEAVKKACKMVASSLSGTVSTGGTYDVCNAVLQNVKVQNGAKLTIKFKADFVEIRPTFEVIAGSQLEIVPNPQ